MKLISKTNINKKGNLFGRLAYLINMEHVKKLYMPNINKNGVPSH